MTANLVNADACELNSWVLLRKKLPIFSYIGTVTDSRQSIGSGFMTLDDFRNFLTNRDNSTFHETYLRGILHF